MQINTFTKEKEWIKSSIEIFQNVCNRDGIINIALSGGNTPKPLYQEVAETDLPFDLIDFFEIDERYIPKDHEDSNTKMIFENLIQKCSPHSFNYFDTSKEIPESLEEYSKIIPTNGFDLSILGIGPDGHTASIFPGSEAIENEVKYVAHTTTKHFAIKDRLTLTFPAILDSKKLLILLKGHEKQHLINEIQNPTKTPTEFPALKLIDHPDLTINYLQ